ncbi:MYB-like transcription factor ETC3 [Tripterygium wilfordii]|uniref:MYB-like transcription factor ETC3 n=1 Tax=Tripterygium wilfordii TaxID=458696 RepID=UPI0018F83A26|nr:MYB-like transcription factor ETC3 [Tripterygium wilfordii]
MGDLQDTSQHPSKDITKDATGKESKLEFTEDEESLIGRMFRLVGQRWGLIAGRIPGRSAEEIEKYWTSKSSSSSSSKHNSF